MEKYFEAELTFFGPVIVAFLIPIASVLGAIVANEISKRFK